MLTTIVEGIAAGVFPARPLDLDHRVAQLGPAADPLRLSSAECRVAWARKRLAPQLAGFVALAEPEVGLV